MTVTASNYARQDLERYYTPAWVVDALLGVEAFDGLTVDPAAGGWHLVEAMRAHGCLCEGFDIAPDPDLVGIWRTENFLSWTIAHSPTDCRNIVTNPPYGKSGRLAVDFIQHALNLTSPIKGKVAMLLRVDFDSAKGRRFIFNDHPAFEAKYVLTKRIRWVNLPQSAAGPTENHAWFVWNWSRPTGWPRLGYLP